MNSPRGICHSNLLQQLSSKSLKYIAPRGNAVSNSLCVIGEAGGEQEELRGYSFVGPSGQEQDRMLNEAGARPSECYFTNVFKVHPPDNKIPRLKEYGIPDTLYYEELLEELSIIKPKVIVLCGQIPTYFLCPQTRPRVKKNKKTGEVKEGTQSFSRWRGSLLISPLLHWEHYCVPVYHPSYILREWSERQLSVLFYSRAAEELSYSIRHSGGLSPLPAYNISLQPDFDKLKQFLVRCTKSSNPIFVDIEKPFWKKKECDIIYSIAIAISPTEAVSFCIWDYTVEQLYTIFRLLDYIFRCKKVYNQNWFLFDSDWLESYGFTVNIDLSDDIRTRHHILWPELPHDLGFMTSQYTRQPFYKDEGKGWNIKEGKNQLLHYGGLDVCVPYEIWNRQEEEFNGA